jgi:hypothetical protein
MKNYKKLKKLVKMDLKNQAVRGGSASGFGPEIAFRHPKFSSGPGIPEARRPH